MRGRLVVILLAGVLGAVNAAAEGGEGRSALTLQLGRPWVGDGHWSAGTISGSACFDRPLAPRLAAVVIAGTARGIATGISHDEIELDNSYVVAGARFTSHPEDRVRLYLLAAIGVLRADSRETSYGWLNGGSSVVRESRTGTTAIVGTGVVASIPHSRFSVVCEASYLMPQTGAPAGLSGTVPAQLLASVGLRVALGR